MDQERKGIHSKGKYQNGDGRKMVAFCHQRKYPSKNGKVGKYITLGKVLK